MSDVESKEVATTSEEEEPTPGIYPPGEPIYPSNDPLNHAVGEYIVMDEEGGWTTEGEAVTREPTE